MQITWRNVNAPDFSGVSRFLDSAQTSFNGLGTSFQNIIEQNKASEVARVNNLRETNKQDFLNYLSQFKSPEELAAAQQSGAVDQRLASLNGVVDQAAVRNAADDRLGYLRNQIVEQNSHQDMLAERGARPAFNNAVDRALAGDMVGARGILDPIDTPNKSAMTKDILGLLTTVTGEGRAVEDQGIKRADLGIRQSDLGMRRGRFNADMDDRQRLLAAEKEQLDAFKKVYSLPKDSQELDKSYIENADKVFMDMKASGYNIPLKSNGDVDVDALDPDTAAMAYNKIGARPSDTQILNSTIGGISAGATQLSTIKAIETLRQEANKQLNLPLAESDQAQVAAIESKLEDQQRLNPFNGMDSQSSTEMVDGLIKENSAKVEDGVVRFQGIENVGDRRVYLKDLQDITRNGITLDNGETYKVPKELISAALKVSESDWVGHDNDLREIVKDLYQTGNYGKDLEEYENTKKKLRTLQYDAKGEYDPDPYAGARVLDKQLRKFK